MQQAQELVQITVDRLLQLVIKPLIDLLVQIIAHRLVNVVIRPLDRVIAELGVLTQRVGAHSHDIADISLPVQHAVDTLLVDLGVFRFRQFDPRPRYATDLAVGFTG